MLTEDLLLVALYKICSDQEEKGELSLPPLQDSAAWLELYQEAYHWFEAKWHETEIPPTLLGKYERAIQKGVDLRVPILVEIHSGSIEEDRIPAMELHQ